MQAGSLERLCSELQRIRLSVMHGSATFATGVYSLSARFRPIAYLKVVYLDIYSSCGILLPPKNGRLPVLVMEFVQFE